ncbi:MAG: tetratricopeptide repeat protein, partial [Phycisphaerales bacterium]|nr:tetratricopeptide repeat protein [Phycisphaerales bacterium]
GQYSVAEKYYKQALQINPDNVEVLNNLAYLLAVKLKHPHQGLSYAEKSNQLAANAQQAGPYAHDPNLLDTLGWLRYLTGDTEGAVSALERSTRYGSVSTAYYHLAIVRNKQGHRTEAEDDLRKAISLAQSQNNPKLQKKATALLSQWTAHAAKPG